jgi:prophage DNA circulation protein
MGRHAIRFTMTAYLLLGDRGIKNPLMDQRDQLIQACQKDDAGMLVHPTLGQMLVMCEKYNYSEQRTRGGYLEFDLTFVEAGSAGMQGISDSNSQLSNTTNNTEQTTSASLNNDLKTAVPLPPSRPVPLPPSRPASASA